jgi:PAS domain S-box-containing protein
MSSVEPEHLAQSRRKQSLAAPAPPTELRSMVSTAELQSRPSRAPDYEAESRALMELSRQMAASPGSILQALAETALNLCNAHSAGLSLLEDGDQRSNFHWRAIAGQWASHVNGGTPRDFGPCGTVLDQNIPMVCSHPERDFPYWAAVRPVLEEALLIPFYIKDEAVGTIWVVAHDTSRRFDAEDLRVMTNLAAFAAGAYQTWLALNALEKTSAMIESRERELRDFLENASVGMHWVGPDGIVLWANRTEMEMLGFTREEYIGHHIAEFHADRPAIEDILNRLTKGETLNNYEARLRCKDLSVRHVLINSNVLWEEGKFIHTRCFTRDITERKQSEQQIALLAHEAEHRAKNVLATVQATVHLSQADTTEGLKEAIEGRIRALANVHKLFVESRWNGAELRTLVEEELAAYADGRVHIAGPNLLLQPDTAQAIAVAVHELATNAAKYGALSTSDGQIHVDWSRAADGRLILHWKEVGGPPVKPPTRRGFGSRVMKSIIAGQLKGETRFDWHAEGLSCEISLQVSN